MKSTLLFSALLLTAPGAFALAAPPSENPSPQTRPDARSDAPSPANTDTTNTAAREELADLRTQMQSLSRRMAELSTQLGDAGPRAYAYRYIGQPDRAMIGVVLASDKDGARVSAVTPDGPAARAGLRDGDVITSIDQHALGASTPDAALANARERVANLKENQSVRIGYRRGTQTGEVTVTAARREALNWPRLLNDDPQHPFLPEDFSERVRAQADRAMRELQRAHIDKDRIRADIDRAKREVASINDKDVRAAMDKARGALRRVMPWWGINLAPVNADLGRYFGVDKGALVIATDADSLPGLRAGDVITQVAGTTVDRPEDVMRVLRDEPAGQKIPMKVMRDRKSLALDVKAPEFKSIFSLPPLPPLAPTPPTPPTAPAPPSAPTPPAPPATPASPAPAPVST